MISFKVLIPSGGRIVSASSLHASNSAISLNILLHSHQLPSTRLFSHTSCRSQNVTNANNQKQLILVARNISLRKSPKSQQASFSSSTSDYSYAHPYVTSATSEIFDYPQAGESPVTIEQREESTFDKIKRKARGAVIRTLDAEHADVDDKFYGQTFNRALVAENGKKLVVIMSWLEAKEKHIEKYRQYYLEQGFDVLNVKTSRLDLLLPAIGANKISHDFVKFLEKNDYKNVVLHNFSVGGYQFGAFLLQLQKQKLDLRNRILNSIKGVVFDSVVPIEGASVGISRTISENDIVSRAIQAVLDFYMVIFYNIATKYYMQASKLVWSGPLMRPILFFMSKDDRVSNCDIVLRLMDVWSRKGIECDKLMFDSSPHVQHFQKHNKEYTSKLEGFLKQILK